MATTNNNKTPRKRTTRKTPPPVEAPEEEKEEAANDNWGGFVNLIFVGIGLVLLTQASDTLFPYKLARWWGTEIAYYIILLCIIGGGESLIALFKPQKRNIWHFLATAGAVVGIIMALNIDAKNKEQRQEVANFQKNVEKATNETLQELNKSQQEYNRQMEQLVRNAENDLQRSEQETQQAADEYERQMNNEGNGDSY